MSINDVDDDALSKKVDSLVCQMDRFSRQIEQYLGEVGSDNEENDSDDDNSDIQYFKMSLNDLLTTSKYSMLRDYQQYGIKWLMTLHTSGLNGIIADEMGLGKTLQVIKFLTVLKNQSGNIGPHLMIGPLSVLSNWFHELNRFSPDEFDIHVHYGPKKEREESFVEACDDWKRVFRKTVKKSTKISIILTTFTIAMHDHLLFKNATKICGKSMEYLILDEAHRIKNQSCVLYKQLKDFPIKHRLLLTGTPLQNNLQELWSLLKFLVPKVFPKHEDIQDWFNHFFLVDSCTAISDPEEAPDSKTILSKKINSKVSPKKGSQKLFEAKSKTSITTSASNTSLLSSKDREKIIHSLHRVLKPFILRRIKADVALDIPHKITKIIKCPLSPLQHELMIVLRTFVHEKISQQQKQHSQIPSSSSSNNNIKNSSNHNHKNKANMPRYLTALLQDSVHDDEETSFATHSLGKTFMIARKLCNHPFLLFEEMKSFTDEMYFENLISASGKLMVLDRLLRHLLPTGSKILIFSQFTGTLDILSSYFSLLGYSYYRIDGSTDQATRQISIDAFNRDSSSLSKSNEEELEDTDDETEREAAHAKREKSREQVQLFILTTPSGGVGINLQAANTVILFDQDWNPQQDLQAISRAHRLGQTDPVLVLRLVSVGPDSDTASIEEMMWEKALRKLQANKAILKNGIFATASRKVFDVYGNSDIVTAISSSPRSSSNATLSTFLSTSSTTSTEDDFEEHSHPEDIAVFQSLLLSEEATTDLDQEKVLDKLAESDLPFQWHSLFMHKSDHPPSSSYVNDDPSTTNAVNNPLKKYELVSQQLQYRNIQWVHPELAESPCCRLRFTAQLPPSTLLWTHNNDTTHKKCQRGAAADNSEVDDDDIWALICDRNEVQTLSPLIAVHAPSVAVTMVEDDFMEITLESSSLSDGDAAIMSTFARELAQYRKFLLPHLHKTPNPQFASSSLPLHPAQTASSQEVAPREEVSPRQRRRRTQSSYHHQYQQDHYLVDEDGHGSGIGSVGGSALLSPEEYHTRHSRGRSRIKDEDYHDEVDNNSGDYGSSMDEDNDAKAYYGAPRGKRKRGVPSKKRGRSLKNKRRRSSKKSKIEESIEDFNSFDSNDICVLCHQAALEEDQYLSLRSAFEQGHNTAVTDLRNGVHEFDRSILQTLLLCDSCDGAYHLVCVGLQEAPEEDWYCALCESAAGVFGAELPAADADALVQEDEEVVQEEGDEENDDDDDEVEEESYRPDEEDDEDDNDSDLQSLDSSYQ